MRLKRKGPVQKSRFGGIVVLLGVTMGLTALASILSFLFVLYEYNGVTEWKKKKKKPHQRSSDIILLEKASPVVTGTYVKLVDGTVEAVYATPSSPSSSSSSSIKGIALLFHACTHSALKFFSPSHTCPSCVGLSEELRISRLLLQHHNYTVLALTSIDRKSGCWNTGTDLSRVHNALSEFQLNQLHQQQNQHTDRIIAIGASSGGFFAVQVARHGIANAAIAMVSALGVPTDDAHTTTTTGIPPIYLAPMPRDRATTKRAREQYLRVKTASPQAPIVLDDTTCVPLPLTMAYLTERVPHLTPHAATEIVRALSEAKHLDRSFYFTQDPTQSDWREVLRRECGDVCLQNQELGPGISPLAKALHRAWAFHEYCSEVIDKAIRFFDSTTISLSQ